MAQALHGTPGTSRRGKSSGNGDNQQEGIHGKMGSVNGRSVQPSRAAYPPPHRTDNRTAAGSKTAQSRRTTGSAASNGRQRNQLSLHHQHEIAASTARTAAAASAPASEAARRRASSAHAAASSAPASRPTPAKSDCRGILDSLITASSSKLSSRPVSVSSSRTRSGARSSNGIGSHQKQNQKSKPPATKQQQSSTKQKAASDARRSVASTKPRSKSKLDMIRQELKTQQISSEMAATTASGGRRKIEPDQNQPDKPSRTDKRHISTKPAGGDREEHTTERLRRQEVKANDEYEDYHQGNQDDVETFSTNLDDSLEESDDESPELDEQNLEMDKSVHYELGIGRNGSIKLADAVDDVQLCDDNNDQDEAESAIVGGSLRFGIPPTQQQHHLSKDSKKSDNTTNKQFSTFETTSSLLSASMRFGTWKEDAVHVGSDSARALSSTHSLQAGVKSLDSSTSASSARSLLSNYPQFVANEIRLGKVLGKGSFGAVSEVLAFDIIDADADDAAGDEKDGRNSMVDIDIKKLRSEGTHRRRSSFMSSTHSISQGDEGRAFLARHCIRSKAVNAKSSQLPIAPQEPQESCESHRTLVCTEDAATRKRVQARLGLPSSSPNTPASSRFSLQIFKTKARSRLTRSGKGDCRYAVKQLREELLDDMNSFNLALQDIINETNILAKIRHPNIVKLRAFGRAGNAGLFASENGNDEDTVCHPTGYFIVLDRLYDTLSRRILAWSKKKAKAEKSILWSSGIEKMRELWMERVVVAYDIGSALSYLHSIGIAYRDLVSTCITFHEGWNN